MGSVVSYVKLLRSINLTRSVSTDYLSSRTLTLINPRKHKFSADTVSLYLPAEKIEHLSDERILALFTKGFFGGPAFRLESLFMKGVGYRILGPPRFDGLNQSSSAKDIWDVATIPSTSLLSVGASIVGSFQVLSSHLPNAPHHHPSYSFIDFGFGSNTSLFAGCHRFVTRRPNVHRVASPWLIPHSNPNAAIPTEDEEISMLQESMADRLGDDEIEIRLEGYYCNPMKSGGSWAEKMAWFHELYARCLFSDGIRAVLAGAENAKVAVETA